MPAETETAIQDSHRPKRSGMSWSLAGVLLVVVVVVAGGVGYVVLSTVSGSGTKTVSTCSPPPVCFVPGLPVDVFLMIVYVGGFGQAIASLDQGQSLPATVAVTGGEPVSQYEISWGDGSRYTGFSPNASHVYSDLGSYIVSARALVGSTWYNGSDYLFPIVVTPNFQTTSSGDYPTIATTLTNGSSAVAQFGWLEGSGFINVSARYTANSTATGYTDRAPALTSTGGTQSGLVSTPDSVAASYAFRTPGIYYITMVGAITAPNGTIYQNYTWTVYVSPAGVTAGCGDCICACSAHSESPHPGEVIYQEVAPGGATTEDPSVAYDTISAEPLYNVYQALVTYNGSTTTSFVPELSTCVPGPGCAAMYGNSLIVNDPSAGAPRYWTFPIDRVARFYDPTTKASWPVYPSDVAFSVARTCAFADLPGFGAQPGWILCQSLLPQGPQTNAKWDSAIHTPYNNTPSNVMGSILINNTTYCPASIMAVSNGCVTFDAWGGGAAWPFFLELVTDPLGGSVEPCGWFTAQNAGVPGFAGSTAKGGDGPCLLPGGAKSTSDSGFQTWIKSVSPTYWDSFEELALNTPGIQPGVRWNMVGSGPYYLTNQPFSQSVGYTLAQSPVYAAPTGCAGQSSCEPLPGPTHYVANVTVVYQSTDTVGIEQYKAAQTDFATIQPGETSQMLSLVEEGKIGVFTVPTLNVNLLAFALEFSVPATKSSDPNPLNVPGDFFNYVGLREFLVNAFPYTTVENTIFTTDGIQYGFNYGGAIPQYMGNYYPTNISWPSGDPVINPTVNGSAAWWWAQATSSSSPYYDPELANCTTSSPCQFPIMGASRGSVVDQLIQDYLPYISQISGGRLAPNSYDGCFPGCQLVVYGLSAQPGQSAEPFFSLGWAPDYPDPTDYMAPLYYPNATYTYSNAVQQGLSLWTCSAGHGAPMGMPTTGNSMTALVFWANQAKIPQACQGDAYAAMEWGMGAAAPLATGPVRVLMYDLIEHIADGLALYVYCDQQNAVTTYAPWIDPTTINSNPMIGGAGDNLWYLVNGSGVLNS
jgi:hypothetical protein